MKTVLIQGSARSDGNTGLIVQELKKHLAFDVIDLKGKNIHPYSYLHENRDDDFLPIMQNVVTYDIIVFISPVYWYTMSGLMKNFFDRITDCLKVDKETGRQLKGMKMLAISCGSEKEETEGFFIPFKNSAQYLGMDYWGSLHTWKNTHNLNKEVITKVQKFAETIKVKKVNI